MLSPLGVQKTNQTQRVGSSAERPTGNARLVLLATLATIIAVFLLWDRIDGWFGDIFLSLSLLSLFGLAVRALLQLRCASREGEG